MAPLDSQSKTKKSWAIKLSFPGISVVERQGDNLAGGVLANSQTSRACFGRIPVFGAIKEHGWLRDRKTTTKEQNKIIFQVTAREVRPIEVWVTQTKKQNNNLILGFLYTFTEKNLQLCQPWSLKKAFKLLLKSHSSPAWIGFFFLSSPSKKHIWG